jgi:hypothetical protein
MNIEDGNLFAFASMHGRNDSDTSPHGGMAKQ